MPTEILKRESMWPEHDLEEQCDESALIFGKTAFRPDGSKMVVKRLK